MNIHTIGYALLCIVVPIAWGLVVVWVSEKIETRRRQPETPPKNPENPDTSSMPPIDYHI